MDAFKHFRLQNTAAEQTPKATAGELRHVTVSNNNAAVQTLTLRDGATDKHVIQVPTKTTLSLAYNFSCATSIKAIASSVDIDALILFD